MFIINTEVDKCTSIIIGHLKAFGYVSGCAWFVIYSVHRQNTRSTKRTKKEQNS